MNYNEDIFAQQKERNIKINISALILGIFLFLILIGGIVALMLVSKINNEKKERLEIMSSIYGYVTEKHYGEYDTYCEFPKFEGSSKMAEAVNELYCSAYETEKDFSDDGTVHGGNSNITINHAGFLSGFYFFDALNLNMEKTKFVGYSFFQNGDILLDMNDPENLFTEEGRKEILSRSLSSIKNKSHLRDLEEENIKIFLYPQKICLMAAVEYEGQFLCEADKRSGKYYIGVLERNIENLKVYYRYEDIDEYIKKDSPIRLLYDPEYRLTDTVFIK